MPTTRRDFIKYGVAGAVGFGVASAIEIPILNNQVQQENSKIQQLEQQLSTTQQELDTAKQGQGFLTLNPKERTLVESIAETMIPTDTGPGAKEAGVINFIDRMLAGNYGKGGNYYLQGPFVLPQTTSVTVKGTDFATGVTSLMTYPQGTITPRLQAGTAYQYAFNPREFWRLGLVYLEDYSKAAYGDQFENLAADKRTQILQDLFDNKPTNFQGPTPAEFFNELHDLVTAGWFTDPLYGGNAGMSSWILIGAVGTNNGNAYGEGYTDAQLMVSATPIRLQPQSLSQLQMAGGH